ncbi:MAG: tRNA (adenosine(37)-N6)-dimethylallyltransferase MiaA [Actinomycetota bacterium]|nr:tRNA (adenosine(37)-N6)-dimethylallyltransferase MiaA [Actinomycetota bacterium]MEC9394497.1 tRNA (adenosine(37)-N6)-dimethylallyltransferase MiaA [Actinomycetota bacterium]MEE2958838.1 tRNA (adenosine(37)-N6)-dimethylallyltransferase MiaA [Actinomycetota bacterium]
MEPNGHLAIVGATASGKSSLALEVARRRPGTELVSMDSMAVYRGMDVGTAAPTLAERVEVPHHLLDLVEPTEEFSVSKFQWAARAVLDDLSARSARAVLVGGTGLHVRAVVDDLEIPGRWDAVRVDLEAEPDTAALHTRLGDLDPVAAGRMESSNRRRIVRALEVTLGSGRPFSSFGPGLKAYPASPFTQVGLHLERNLLDRRIADRYRRQLDEGFLDEVRALAEVPGGLSSTAAQALGYRELLAHLRGECTLEAAIDDAAAATRRFARRQERWFRRDPRIEWFEVGEDPLVVLDDVLERFDACRP